MCSNFFFTPGFGVGFPQNLGFDFSVYGRRTAEAGRIAAAASIRVHSQSTTDFLCPERVDNFVQQYKL